MVFVSILCFKISDTVLLKKGQLNFTNLKNAKYVNTSIFYLKVREKLLKCLPWDPNIIPFRGY